MSTIDPHAPLKPWSDAERVAHIREQAAKAEMHGGKLRRGDVEEIRTLYAEGEMTVPEIGQLFGVTRGVIQDVAMGHSWGYPPLSPRRSGPRRKAA